MIYPNSRGLKCINVLSNEMLQANDTNFLSESGYDAMTEMAQALAEVLTGDNSDTVLSGLTLTKTDLLQIMVAPGLVVGYGGYYYKNNSFGFDSDVDGFFSAVLPEEQVLVFDDNSAGTYDRIDIVEIRPARQEYDSKARQFRDPITSLVSSTTMNVKVEHYAEVQITKGDASQVAYVPSTTSGWVKLGEVVIEAGASEITNVYDTLSLNNWLGSLTYRTTATENTTPLRLVLRDSNGEINTPDNPTVDSKVTNKKYVDDQIYTNVTPIIIMNQINTDTTLTSPGKYHITSPVVVTLPANLDSFINKEIEIYTDSYCRVVQNHASAGIHYKYKYFTTKGVYVSTIGQETGYIKMRPGTFLKLSYVGSSVSKLSQFIKLSDPSTLPTGNGYSTAFSPDGNYLVIGHLVSPYVTIYKRSGDTFTKLSDPATLPLGAVYGCAFSPDGNYLALACRTTSPYVTIYKRSGDTFTKLSDPATLPAGTGYGCAFSPDGNYLVIGHSSTPFFSIYRRVEDTFIKLSNPDDIPASTVNGCAFSPDGNYLVLVTASSPYIFIYKIAGDIFKNIDNPTTLPGGSVNKCTFSPNGQYLILVDGYLNLLIYSHLKDTFIKQTDPITLPVSTGRDCAFSPENNYLAIAHSSSPYASVYKTVEEITNGWIIKSLETKTEQEQLFMLN